MTKLLLLAGRVTGEEESILTNATVFASQGTIANYWSPDSNALIRGTFKSHTHSNDAYSKVHFTIDFKESQNINSIFMLNRAERERN